MAATFTITQEPTTSNLWLYPTGNKVTEQTPVGDSTNYLCIDEERDAFDNGATYVHSDDVSSVTDVYSLTDHTDESGTINSLTFYVRGRSHLYDQHPSGVYKAIIDTSGATSYSPNFDTVTDWTLFYYTLNSNPSTDTTWTWNDVDNTAIGIESSSPSVEVTEKNMTLYVNAAGGPTANCVAVGDSPNWKCVDEQGLHDGDTTYIKTLSSVSDWSQDCYNYQDSDDTGDITHVRVVYIGRHDTSASPNWAKVRPYLHMGGTDYPGGNFITMTPSWQTYGHNWTSQPSDASAWNWDAVDSLEAGVRLWDASDNLGQTNVTQVYLVVNYDPPEVISPDIQTTSCYCRVNYTSSEATNYLNKPTTYTLSNNRDVKKINFWSGERAVYGVGRNNKTLSMTGCEWNETSSTATVRLKAIKDIQETGAEITISGFDDSYINTTWRISDFSYERDSSNPQKWNYSLTGEKT